jgi:hypothetical protein
VRQHSEHSATSPLEFFKSCLGFTSKWPNSLQCLPWTICNLTSAISVLRAYTTKTNKQKNTQHKKVGTQVSASSPPWVLVGLHGNPKGDAAEVCMEKLPDMVPWSQTIHFMCRKRSPCTRALYLSRVQSCHKKMYGSILLKKCSNSIYKMHNALAL